ncbi:MAG: DUF481 domain-containing protein [Opitutaceae bacterium]|jgi:hypothetical protein|nr:DUF481 domain-containing protein [Opitutaceae bacterium]
MFPLARSLIALAALSLLAGAGLRADVLTLANGDKLKGKLVKNVDDMITFKSDILGEIIVPTTKAKVEVDLTPEQKAALAAKAAEEKRIAEAKAKEAAEKKKAEARQNLKLAKFNPIEVRSAAKAPRTTKVDDTGWLSRIELGLTNQTGRVETTSIYLRTENNRRTPKTETRFLNNLNYTRTNGVRTVDSFNSNLRFRRTLTGERLFAQSNTRYARDSVTSIKADVDQGIGLGYNIVSLKNLMLAAGTDAAVRYQSFMQKGTAARPPDRTSTIMDFFEDMSLTINPRFSLTQEFIAVLNPEDFDERKFNFNAGLTGKVTRTFNITTRLELEYYKADTVAEDQRYNQRIITTLAYVF